MRLDPMPTSLTCSVCGASVDDAGYLPATERDAGYRPSLDDAVCGTCGFNEVGMMGCAPELADVGTDDDVLLYVERTGAGFDVVSVKR
ncbi:hypothetical protein [Haloplanus aerogenes]|uniref:Uncharacterized protein n=1 Tax=Haloplanus aerogenes TaxID=660522 RepID=A0A3M0DU81_9EURY|nr:hypothetical protein [Haloplanus aerogenes]AZH25784.1 hypothetical protein DU502_10515 [Haloplanus aerogenes]RMB25521.1 hypothetical protein ATH50_0618 [Haloplanus aerogenes]